MQCPNCQNEVREGAAFCSMCGAAIPVAPSEVTPPIEPTTPAPATPAPPADEEYARQLAEYERQRAAYDQQQPAAQQPAAPAAGQQAPPKKRKTGLIIALVIVILFGCLACGVGGFFGYRAWKTATKVEVGPNEEPDGGETDGALAGHATAEEAVVAELDEAGYGDWVYQLYEEGDTQVTYWAGPPQSEFAEEIVVTRNADGSWSVAEVNPLDFGGDVPGDVSAKDEATGIVSQFLYAVQDDRGEDAHALTVEPFSNDAASAQVSAGGLETFEVSGATGLSDGSFWVQTVQVWYGAKERWEYWVVPTEAGYAIADVREW